MRSPMDRIRHAVGFEVLGLVLVTPLASRVFGLALTDTGVVALGSATVAMLWNAIYNYGFDRALLAMGLGTRKKPLVRVLHAILFEAGLLVILVPPIAGYLGIGLRDAFLIDVGLAAFYVVYAFVFNWLYDAIFPLPEWRAQAAASRAASDRKSNA